MIPDVPDGKAASPTPIPIGPTPVGVGLGAALALAVVAGMAAWAGGEAAIRAFDVPLISEFEVSGGEQFSARNQAITNTSTASYGVLGAMLGLAMGLAAGLRRRDPKRMVAATAAGLVLGAIAAGVVAWVATRWFLANEVPLEDDLIRPLLSHGAIGSAIGLAAGLAAGIGLGGGRASILQAALGGLIGGIVATFVIEMAGAVLFPLEQTDQPVSQGVASRLFGRLVLAVFVAMGLVLSTRPPRPGPPAIPNNPPN